MLREPLVSIVTPTYNMAKYLEETIQSVLSQDYPHIEYLVMDAGSTDGTLEILRKYEGRLRYVSEPDDGQADAVNKGIRQTRGEIVAFLNADDIYLPGAVRAAVEAFRENPESAVVYGQAYYTSQSGEIIRRYPTVDYDPDLFRTQCYICQPATFIRRDVWDEMQGLNVRLHYALDYDLWIRISRRYPMTAIPQFVATSRMYADNKTIRLRRLGLTEIIGLLRQHFSYVPPHWIYAYCSTYLHKKADGFFIPDPATPHCFLATAFVGSWINRGSLPRYWMDCARMIKPGLRILASKLIPAIRTDSE
ncbi:MAG: glycosyltransferase [Bryobacteraceae bacterium]|nr:glycosyltransferase [Bryobacteraceae bacterium]